MLEARTFHIDHQAPLVVHYIYSTTVLQEEPAAMYVQSHREAVWLVGPIFAALTGMRSSIN